MFKTLIKGNVEEVDPAKETFINYSGLSDHLVKGFPVSGNIRLGYRNWRGFKSNTKKYKALRRAFLTASHVVSLELKGGWPSPLSRLESDLFSDFLKENMSLRSFKCESELLTPSMVEALMSSQTVDEIYIPAAFLLSRMFKSEDHNPSPTVDEIYFPSAPLNHRLLEDEDRNAVDEAFTQFAKNSQASFMLISNVKFSQDLPISGILRAANLTSLHLPSCGMSESETSVLCKLLATHDNLKTFVSNIVFEVKYLILYWYGESDPRPDLKWDEVTIKGSYKMGVFLKRFIRERVHEASFVYKDKVLKPETLLRSHFATLERLVKPERFDWPNDYPGLYVGNIFRVGSLKFMSNLFPQAKGLIEFMSADYLQLRLDDLELRLQSLRLDDSLL